MNRKNEIMICLGSSCFARGNKATLKVIVKYLEDHNLKDKVYFHGGHCFGKCAEGPIVKINSKIFTGVDEYNVIDILTNELNEE
ncbi:hypothetical protein CYCD_23010 [Tenuifilaceae bacterium CYCD]|nr:hypothetical protein CYCD_23010 [Tenuifilaceae bacterium CYCD]